MNQICCLNPDCDNPSIPDTTKFCLNCGIPLIILRNRYRPIKRLGGGGFGKTYLAEDIDNLNGKCVIKQLAPQTQNTYALKKATELFEEEAKRLKNLEHPQIPKLKAYFNQDNRLYLIQDFIAGEDLLSELNNQGNFTEQKIRELLLNLLPVLQIVHDQKIIHRDIKPENIMRRSSDGKLFLIDFGASKEVRGTMQPGTKIGTYGYAAIEQMEDREVYPASDLFSIGASCFHLLTGVYPGNLWNRQGYSWTNNWRSHLPQPVTVELGVILDKLLQLEYSDRYQSAQEVLTVLQTPPKPKPQPPQPQKIQTPVKPQPRISQPTNSTRRNFLQYAGLFTGGAIVTVIAQNLFNNRSYPTYPTNISTISTISPEVISSPSLTDRLRDAKESEKVILTPSTENTPEVTSSPSLTDRLRDAKESEKVILTPSTENTPLVPPTRKLENLQKGWVIRTQKPTTINQTTYENSTSFKVIERINENANKEVKVILQSCQPASNIPNIRIETSISDLKKLEEKQEIRLIQANEPDGCNSSNDF